MLLDLDEFIEEYLFTTPVVLIKDTNHFRSIPKIKMYFWEPFVVWNPERKYFAFYRKTSKITKPSEKYKRKVRNMFKMKN